MAAKTRVRTACALLLLAVAAAYANSFGSAFHFDDFHTVTDNPAVRSLRNVPRFFTDATTFSVLPANRTYRPVVSTSLAVDYALGRGYAPFWFHLSTFCWFAVLIWLLFRMYRTMYARSSMGEEGGAASGVWLALTGAAWFGLHPAMAETVNYVIQRGDLYCTLGCVAALVIYADDPRRRRTGLYLLPLGLALLSKPPAAVFPVLLLLWVYFFESPEAVSSPARWKKGALAILPSLVVVLGLLGVQSAMTPKSFTPTILSAAEYRLTQPYVWLRYAAELFLPVHLNVDTELTPFAEMNGRALLGLLFLLALLYGIWRTVRRRELYPVAFGLLWFVVTQLPTSLYPLSEVENDHRMFFSFAGLIPAVVWGAFLLLRRVAGDEAVRRMRPLLAAATVAVLLSYACGVHARNAVWHDEESLWRDDVEKSPQNGRGLMIYGLTQMNKGDYPAALELYHRALRYTPNYATLEINLGVVNGALGNQAEAQQHFERAIRLQPGDDTTHTYYGRWLLMQGRAEDAAEQMRTAVALNPQREMQRRLLVAALRESGDVEGARQAAAEAAKMFPGEGVELSAPLQEGVAYWINRSLVLNQQGRYDESIAAAQAALRLDPRSAEAWNNIAANQEALRAWDKAIAAAQKAVALKPDFQLAKNNLAWSEEQKKLGR